MAPTRFGAISTTRLDNYTATVDPTVNDDSGDGYDVGSLWCNTSSKQAFICTDASVGAAVWIQITGSGLGGTTLFPRPVGDNALNTVALSVSTGRVGVVYLPARIDAARVTLVVSAAGNAGARIRFALYSLDGQTKLIDVTGILGNGTGQQGTTFGAITVPPGYYYAFFCRDDVAGGANPSVRVSRSHATIDDLPDSGPTSSLIDSEGTFAVTAGAAPTTFDPTSLTVAINCVLCFRLDNA
jgi:hypothetical protein